MAILTATLPVAALANGTDFLFASIDSTVPILKFYANNKQVRSDCRFTLNCNFKVKNIVDLPLGLAHIMEYLASEYPQAH